MAKSNPSNLEDRIELAKEAFQAQLDLLLMAISADVDANAIQQAITDVHAQATKFFNIFDRSVAEQGLKSSEANENTINAKVDETVNISNTILKYWKLLHRLKETYPVSIPRPSERAYSSMQTFLKTYDPKKAKELRTQYQAEGLPTYGFENTRTFIDMTKKQQITYGVIAGTVLLIALLIIILVVKCPTEAQDKIFTIILALAGAAFSMVLTGFLNVNYRQIITAGGAFAVFVAIFLLKPAQISTFSSCAANLSGTVYFGEQPQSNVEIRLLQQNQLTNTDNFGNFSLPIDYATVHGTLHIQVKHTELGIDTITSFSQSVIRKPIGIPITQHCVTCVQKDSLENVVNRAPQQCHGNFNAVTEYIASYTEVAAQQKLTAECQVTQRVKK